MENINAAAGETLESDKRAALPIPGARQCRNQPAGAHNLANQSERSEVGNTGTTTRTATLTTVLTATTVLFRGWSRYLPSDLLPVEGSKNLDVNSEQQSIVVRGIIRTTDILTNNTIASTQIADMEIRVNGKGVVGDAIRRPNALYRFLLGILPF